MAACAVPCRRRARTRRRGGRSGRRRRRRPRRIVGHGPRPRRPRRRRGPRRPARRDGQPAGRRGTGPVVRDEPDPRGGRHRPLRPGGLPGRGAGARRCGRAPHASGAGGGLRLHPRAVRPRRRGAGRPRDARRLRRHGERRAPRDRRRRPAAGQPGVRAGAAGARAGARRQPPGIVRFRVMAAAVRLGPRDPGARGGHLPPHRPRRPAPDRWRVGPARARPGPGARDSMRTSPPDAGPGRSR